MKRLSLTLFLFSIYYLLFTIKPVSAAGEFSTAYDISYAVEKSGVTGVTYQIQVTNLTTQYYVSEYDLILPSLKVSEVAAKDSGGEIMPQIIKEESQTKIHLTFNDRVVGKGKVLSFTLFYKTPEIAQKNGRIWEINLPSRTENPEIAAYNVRLSVPKSFGPPAYLSPKPAANLSWTKEEMGSGVVAAFGDYQLFNFNLKYHLDNPKIFPVYTEITLPQDTAYQQVKFKSLKPEPVEVRLDENGNWLARYNLSPGEKIEVLVSGLVKIFPFPTFRKPQDEQNLIQFLNDRKYWEVKDEEIQKLAQKLKTPKEIYDFVVSTLKYDYQKVQGKGERLGAKKALENPQNAICMEFTDLFIALARAAGIPAREVDGFAYTTDSKLRPLSLEKDILHAWPEYWDRERERWVMVDPTWGSTTGGIDYFSKLDFNHFAFVTRGLSSEFPLPAGAYKLNGEGGKDVEVTFSTEDWQEPNVQYSIDWRMPRWVIGNLGLSGSIKIKNKGLAAFYGKGVKLDSSPPNLLKNQPVDLSLAPFESDTLNLEFKKPGWFENFSGVLFLTLDGETFSTPFRVTSLGWVVLTALTIILTLFLLTFILLKVIRRSKKPTALKKFDVKLTN